jgi:hypothetical protein
MSQDIRDRFAAGTPVQHVGSGTMASPMAPSPRADGHTGSEARLPHHPPDGAVNRAGSPWWTAWEKPSSAVALRPTVGQIGGQGMAHLLREGQTTCLVGLTRADTELAGVPIDIVSAEGDHFLSAQTKPSQEEEHRAMAPTGGRVTLVDR